MKMKNWMRSAGFTLVELIVVIAILGILGAGAAVGYSGYVKKANEAADQQLLYDANIALAAACIENGTDITRVGDAELSTTAVVSNVKIGDTVNDDIAASYTKYMETTGSFKAIEPAFDEEEHRFVAATKINLYGREIVLNPQFIRQLGRSTFITAEGLGTEGLLDRVANIAGMAGALGSTFEKLYSSPEFAKFTADTLGVTLTQEEMQDMEAVWQKLETVIEQKGLEDALGNITVLYAAKNATNMDKDSINTIFSNPQGIKDSIKQKFDTDPTSALSEASLVYGLYTTYIYSKNDMTADEKAAATNDPSTVMNVLNDSAKAAEFKAYIDSEQGQMDLDGYMASLNMINSSAGDPDAVTQLLKNGYNDAELVNLFKGLLGA